MSASTCVRGHADWRIGKDGWRRCRACDREYQRSRYRSDYYKEWYWRGGGRERVLPRLRAYYQRVLRGRPMSDRRREQMARAREKWEALAPLRGVPAREVPSVVLDVALLRRQMKQEARNRWRSRKTA